MSCLGRRRSLVGQRDFKAERAALAVDTVEAHPAAMPLDNLVDQVQSQAGAINIPRLIGLYPEEWLKEFALHRLWHAKAGIFNLQHRQSADLLQQQFDAASIRRVFDGVADQVGD